MRSRKPPEALIVKLCPGPSTCEPDQVSVVPFAGQSTPPSGSLHPTRPNITPGGRLESVNSACRLVSVISALPLFSTVIVKFIALPLTCVLAELGLCEIYASPVGVTGVFVAVAVAVGVSVAVAVTVGVFVAVAVAISVGVGMLVGVFVGTGVLVGWFVGESVAVAVLVGARVLVAVSVG